MAVKIVIEPIFEADFQENSYGFRPGRSAHQALQDVVVLCKGKADRIVRGIQKVLEGLETDPS